MIADLVLVLHAAIAAFVVGGLVLVILGNLKGWPWVNVPWFRLAHVAAIAFIAAEAWLGITCPLTRLEMWLRAQAGESTYGGDFIAHWFQRLLYYNAPPWVFILAYSVFGLLVLAAWVVFPPRWKRAGR